MFNRSLFTAFLLLGGLALAANPTGSITLVDQFQPQSVTASSNSTYRVQIGSTEAQVLTGLGFSVDLSAAYSQLGSFTSTCGGTVSFQGTVATFSGGSLPIAPSTSQPTLCDVTISGTSVALSGTKTVSIPAQNVVTDQNLTNAASTASTLTVTPLKALSINSTSTQYRDGFTKPGNYFTYANITLNSTNLVRTTISNSNNRAITGISFTKENSATSLITSIVARPDLSTCTNPDDLASLSAVSLGSNNTNFSYSGLTLSAGASCTVATMITYKATADTLTGNSTYPETFPQAYSGQNQPMTTLTHNDQDPLLNTSSRGLEDINLGFGAAKNFNGQGSYNLQSDTSPNLTLNVLVSNNTYYPGTYSLTDVIPAALAAASPIVTVSTASTYSGSTCDAQGVTLDTASNTLTLQNVTLGPLTMCQYSVTLQKPASLSGTLGNSITSASSGQSNAVYTVSVGDTQNGTSAYAQVINSQVVRASKADKIGRYKGYNWYEITLSNDATFSVTDISFTDSWAHGLLIDPANLGSQCGGQVTVNPDRKGISFTGGSLAPKSSCTVYIDIDPNTALEGYYPNTTSAIQTSAGTLSALSGGINITRPTLLNSPQVTLAQNSPGILSSTLVNTTAFSQTMTVSAPIPTGLNIDLTKPVTANCTTFENLSSISTTKPSYTLRPEQVSVTGNTFSITDTFDPVPRPRTHTSYETWTSFANNSSACTYTYTVISTIQGSTAVQGTVTSEGTTTLAPAGYYQNGLLLNYLTTPPISYTVNKAFTPQTVVAGQDTSLSFSLAQNGTPSTFTDYSPTYAQITDHLPEGMLVSATNFTPNQADGSYRSSDVVPTNLNLPTSGQPCLEINAARNQIISRCRNLYNKINIRIVKYGDLINTLQISDVEPFYGQIVAPASASAKATRGVPIEKSFSPTTIKSGQQSSLNILVSNAQPELSGDNIITFNDVLPSFISAASGNLSVSGTCTGAQASYTPASNTITFSGITLAPNTNCTLSVPVTGQHSFTYAVATTNAIPANAVNSSIGGTNVQPTSATLTILPGPAQPGITKQQGLCNDSSCQGVRYTSEPIDVQPCAFMAYRITFNNLAGSNLIAPVVSDPWPAKLLYRNATAQSPSPLLWQVASGPLSPTPPTSNTVRSGDVLRFGVDSNSDGQLTAQDSLSAGQSVSVTLIGQVDGPGCR